MLTLPIKGKWFDMIVSGEKKEEYREIKPYYEVRLQNLFGVVLLERKGSVEEILRGVLPKSIQRDEVQEIIFRHGYSKEARKIKCKCRLALGEGKEEWGAVPGTKYFILQIEEVEEI